MPPAKKEPVAVQRHELQTIVLPSHMSTAQAIEALELRRKEDEKFINKRRDYTEWHWRDVYVAVNRAMQDTFGWVDARAVPTFFGEIPPQAIRIEHAPNQWGEFIWHKMGLPVWEGDAQLVKANDTPEFAILVVNCKQKYADQVNEFFTRIDRQLAEHSIYKGQAVDSEFNYVKNLPESAKDLVFDPSVEASVQANIFTPIREWETCEKLGLNPKRGILLVGPYGTGKTMTAMATAREAVANGWSYMYVKTEHTERFAQIVEQALKYAPVVIFLEDIDTIAQGGRTVDMNTVLNIMDGVATKGQKLMMVLSTNHVDLINPALMRPGRLDAVIELQFPDTETRARLLKKYTKLPAKDVDFMKAAAACIDEHNDGYTGATLREVASRAALYALSAKRKTVDTQDLIFAAEGVRAQVNMTRKVVVPETPSLDKRITELVQAHADRTIRAHGEDPADYPVSLNGSHK